MLQHSFSSEILMQRWRLQPKIPTEFSLLSIFTIVGTLTLFLILSTVFFSGYTAELLVIQATVVILIVLILYILYISGSWFELFVLVAEQISIISDTLRIERHRTRCEERGRLTKKTARAPTPVEKTVDVERGFEREEETVPKPGSTSGYLKLDANNINKLFQRQRW